MSTIDSLAKEESPPRGYVEFEQWLRIRTDIVADNLKAWRKRLGTASVTYCEVDETGYVAPDIAVPALEPEQFIVRRKITDDVYYSPPQCCDFRRELLAATETLVADLRRDLEERPKLEKR